MIASDFWQAATLVSHQDITPTVREFCLHVPTLQSWQAGAHLPIRLALNGRGQTRHYSLLGQPSDGSYRIAVKHQVNGRGGSRAMWSLQLGDTVSVGQPAHHFALDLTAPHHLLVAGGIGITPMLAMARVLQGRSSRLLFAASTHSELAYRAELVQMLGTPNCHFACDDQGQKLDFAAEFAHAPTAAHLVMCGPLGFMQAARTAWLACGRSESQVHWETFGSNTPANAQSYTVKLPAYGREISVDGQTSLLDALELAGVPVLNDCRRGECGLCAIDVLDVDGEIVHGDVFLSPAEQAANHKICACVSRLQGRSITLDTGYRP